MFSVSVHRSVPEGITWDVEKAWLKTIAGSGITVGGGFGLQTFGTAVETIYALDDITAASEASQIEDSFDDITFSTANNIVGTFGNDLRLAMV